LFITIAALLAVTARDAVASGPVLGTVQPETPAGILSGHAYYDLTTGALVWEANPAPLAAVDVYSNTASPGLFAISSTDLGAIWGDEVFSTDTGVLDQSDFTVFNANVSAGTLSSGSFHVDFIDAGDFSYLGGYSTNVIDFGPGGVPAGFYVVITVTGLAALGIDLTSTDLLIEQNVVSHTGPATRLGIVGLDPVTVGTGSATMFISATTIGPAGYYAIGGIARANPGYRVAVLQPVPVKGKTWGGVKGSYR
jgi:hypothetical protein